MINVRNYKEFRVENNKYIDYATFSLKKKHLLKLCCNYSKIFVYCKKKDHDRNLRPKQVRANSI